MKISIEDSSLTRSPGGALLGRIYLNHDDLFFPEQGWSDFPVVLLGWWLTEFSALKKNRSCEFLFMDGPFSVELVADDADNVRMRCMRRDACVYSWTTTTPAVAAQLRSAAEFLLRFCQSNQFETTDVAVIRQNLLTLESHKI